MNINPRQMQQMMRRMGVNQSDLSAKRVVISLIDKELVFENPNVQKVNAMGQISFQVTGNFTEQTIDVTPDISDDDIKMIQDQTGKEKTIIQSTLVKNKGDIAKTILELS